MVSPRPGVRAVGNRGCLNRQRPHRPDALLAWNLIPLLHMFRKDTGKLSEREIDIAKQRWGDFKKRMDAEQRRPPRAAGHDAP